MESFAAMILAFNQRFQENPLDQVFHELLEHTGIIRELEKQESSSAKLKERRIAVVYEFERSVHLYIKEHPEKQLKDFLERLMLFSLDNPKEDNKSNQVALMTLHSAKGLEFPYVFIVGMAEGVFPNNRALLEGGESEERRLCYVGITRAKKELTFSMAKQRKRYAETIQQQPSRFLQEINPNLFTVPINGKQDSNQKRQQKEQSRIDFFAYLQKFRA